MLIAILALYIGATTYKSFAANQTEPVKIVQKEIDSKKYIITEEMVMSKLTAKSQLVSMQQSFSKSYTDVDDNWLGNRKTEFDVSGVYKFGLDANNIKIKHIESDKGIIHIALPDPKLISLEIPYNKINIHKEQGFFRAGMSDDEKKEFYRVVEKDIRKKLICDKQIQKQAKLYNQEVVKELLNNLAGVKYVIFE